MDTIIRVATTKDLPSISDLVISVDRMVHSDEIQSWMVKDPQALFLAEISSQIDAKKELVGVCCGTILDSDLGFMGLYMVKEDIRGKGIGSKLWKTTKEHIGDRNIGVCAKIHYLEKYREKEGFEHIQDYVIKYYECFGDSMPTSIAWPSEISTVKFFEGKLTNYRNIQDNVMVDSSNEFCQIAERGDKSMDYSRKEVLDENYETTTSLSAMPSKNSVLKAVDGANEEAFTKSFTEARSRDILISSQNTTTTNQMIDLRGTCLRTETIMSKVVEYDKSLHSRDRSIEVGQTFTWSSCKSSVALVSERVVGYGCLRPVLSGHWMISPLYADSEAIAEVILFDLLQGFDFAKAPKGVIIRIPDKNISAERLILKFGFDEENEHILTGFTRHCVERDISRIYSFHSTAFCCE